MPDLIELGCWWNTIYSSALVTVISKFMEYNDSTVVVTTKEYDEAISMGMGAPSGVTTGPNIYGRLVQVTGTTTSLSNLGVMCVS